MIDIVDRLKFDATRCEAQFSKGVAGNIAAAAEEIKRLRAALEPFAKMAGFCHPRHRDSRPFIFGFDTAVAQRLTIGDLRSAAAALAPSDGANADVGEGQ